MVYDYFASGAGAEATVRSNRADFDRIRLRPRLLVGVGQRDHSTTIFGQKLPSPIAVAPMAFQKMAHPEGEIAAVRGAGAAGALFVAGTTAYATVRAVGATSGDTVVVSGAAGGVGSLAVQLAVLAGATVIGLAGESNHQWLLEHGVIPVAYGDGVAGRIREVSEGHVDAFIDTFGSGYVALAVDELGVPPDRVDTIIDWEAGQKYGVKMEGTAFASSAGVVAELAQLIDDGRLEVPIAKVYPLEDVRDAFRELEQRYTRGKIVLRP